MTDPTPGKRVPKSAQYGADDDLAHRVAFEKAGGLERRAFVAMPGLEAYDPTWLGALSHSLADDLAKLRDPARNDTGYRPDNGYFDSPDGDILYLMIRYFQPRRIIEIGCGNSTRVTRQAIIDGALGTAIIAVDPYPRADISHLVDRQETSRAETLPDSFFADLGEGDVLFIDSSHQVRLGNDVAHLFCRIIPQLAPGVVIHVHDIFLPYEYPKRFFYDCPSWGEQYMLHALMQGGGYDILWPGYFLQRERPETAETLPFIDNGRAHSFWLQKR